MAQFSSCQPAGGCVPSSYRLTTTPLVGDTGLEGQMGRREEVGFLHLLQRGVMAFSMLLKPEQMNSQALLLLPYKHCDGRGCSFPQYDALFFSMEPGKDLAQNRGRIVRLKPPKNKQDSDQNL